tara:strand:- start:2592 stop:2858 length:267 start_codon:yes stop_codon:yes gene_type:complete
MKVKFDGHPWNVESMNSQGLVTMTRPANGHKGMRVHIELPFNYIKNQVVRTVLRKRNCTGKSHSIKPTMITKRVKDRNGWWRKTSVPK